MSVASGSASKRELRFQEVAAEYLEAREAGRFGELSALLARHPDLAGEIAAFVADQDEVAHLAAPLRAAVAPAGEVLPLALPGDHGRLGDFRIIREVGRGGMGVVYEAEQVSLGRRVALKVLPFAATMDPRQLQRFHNEARAAAGLHHTNIVPVFGVGCERGVHYYAMQFIDGRTLADYIAEQRGRAVAQVPTVAVARAAAASATTAPPAAQATSAAPRDAAYFRRVAEWGIQAAEALDCAHSLGVVHRDVKPANLLVDGSGRLWVTDFGLAQVQSDARLTMTGDLVGTLRYMSPEQALAKRVVIDHRTDVYSLGATLYELLTLEPAFNGADRQELLRQIAFEEPKPPRRVNKAIPAELETVVLKALEKNPQERYATAKALADDLRRWLEDRPIRARRPTLVQRARKWARRHRPLVGAAVTVVLLAGATLAASLGWEVHRWSSQRQATQEVAEEALQESERWQEQRRLPEAISAARRAKGLVAAGTATDSLQRQVQARVDDLELVERLEQLRLEYVPSGDTRDEASQDRGFAEQFRASGLDVDALTVEEAGRRIRQSTVPVELAATLDQWALIRRRLSGWGDVGWKHLLRVARAADPHEQRDQLRTVLEERGLDRQELEAIAVPSKVAGLTPPTLLVLGAALKSVGAREEAVAMLRQAHRTYPGDYWVNKDLADTLGNLKPPRHEEAMRYYTAALAIRPQSADAHLDLGFGLQNMGDLDGAIIEYRECMRLKNDYAIPHNNLGNALHDKGDVDGAIVEYREALRLKKDYAEAHNNLGNALVDKGDVDSAIAEYEEALRLNKNFDAPHVGLGNALRHKGDVDGAIAEVRQAIRLNQDRAHSHNNLGLLLRSKGDVDGAIAEFREAIRLKKDSADAHSNLGIALKDKGDVAGAIAEFREAIRLKRDHAEVHYSLAIALKDEGRLGEATVECRQAIRIKEDYADAHCALGYMLEQAGQFAEALSHRRRGHELGSKRPLWPYPSAQWVKECERLVELDAKLPRMLKGEAQSADLDERLTLAWMCQLPTKALYAAAVRFYTDAFTEQRQLADDLQSQFRYNAASAAALAGCGLGKDADQTDATERARLRRQALEWLRADLAAYRRLLEKEPDKDGPLVRERMQHWQQDKDFAGVRGPDSLAKLPEAERQEWQQFWQEVEALRQRAAKP